MALLVATLIQAMLMIEDILALVALFILGRYLWTKHSARVQERFVQLEDLNWQAKGFDPAPLKPRMEALRKDYTAELGLRQPDTFKPRMLRVARHLVCGLEYFRDRVSSETDDAASSLRPHAR